MGKKPPPPPLEAEPTDGQASTAHDCLRQQHGGREKAGQAWLLCCRQSLPTSHLCSLLLKEALTGVTLAPQHHRSKTPCFSVMLLLLA